MAAFLRVFGVTELLLEQRGLSIPEFFRRLSRPMLTDRLMEACLLPTQVCQLLFKGESSPQVANAEGDKFLSLACLLLWARVTAFVPKVKWLPRPCGVCRAISDRLAPWAFTGQNFNLSKLKYSRTYKDKYK